MKSPKLRKSITNKAKKKYKKSRTKRILKGGFILNPELAIDPVFQYFIKEHLSIDIFAGDIAPLIKENDNIRIISVHKEEGQDELIQNIIDNGIENQKNEIINLPNPDEKIYFLTNKKFNIDDKNDFRIYDFDTLLHTSNNNIIGRETRCLFNTNFPLINFFYSKALTLAYWNKIYKDLNLIGSGKKLNIFNFHSTINTSLFITHFVTVNSINIMISCNNSGTDNYHTIISILARNRVVDTPIFIGFSGWITVWGSNLMARKIKEQAILPEPGKECNNLLTKIQALYYYMDTSVRSKYTQEIITRNIRDMISNPSEPIQYVDESNCSKENLSERVKLSTLYSCPDEIKFIPKSKPHVLLDTDPSNKEELAFRAFLDYDIADRLDQTHYNIHLGVIKHKLTPQILECIQFYISRFIQNNQELILRIKHGVSENQIDIDYYINLIENSSKTGWNVIDVALGIDEYFHEIIYNLRKLKPNFYSEKLNITLDFIEITINPNLGFPYLNIKFDIHTGNTIDNTYMMPIKTIDKFMSEMAKYKPF